MPVITITPKGGLHVGRLGVGREGAWPYVPSDTLFAALVATMAQTREGVLPLDPLPFSLTSAFPRLGNTRLYPRPLVNVRCAEERREQLGKTLTKFAWCSPKIFDALRQREDMTAWADEKYFVQGGEVWLHPDDVPSSFKLLLDFGGKGKPADYNKSFKLWETDPPVARVALHRTSSASNLFHSGRVQFAPGCGLWFGLTLNTPDAEARVKRALERLADSGLGGLRSVGMGGFAYTWASETLNASPGALGVTLARYLPKNAQEIAQTLKAPEAAYQFVVVGGWCWDDDGRPWRRKRVRFVREGSVIGWGGGWLGRVADVTPDGVGHFANEHHVWRYGIAFPLAIEKEAGT
jgi:CRISPR-associated protein Csm4